MSLIKLTYTFPAYETTLVLDGLEAVRLNFTPDKMGYDRRIRNYECSSLPTLIEARSAESGDLVFKVRIEHGNEEFKATRPSLPKYAMNLMMNLLINPILVNRDGGGVDRFYFRHWYKSELYFSSATCINNYPIGLLTPSTVEYTQVSEMSELDGEYRKFNLMNPMMGETLENALNSVLYSNLQFPEDTLTPTMNVSRINAPLPFYFVGSSLPFPGGSMNAIRYTT